MVGAKNTKGDRICYKFRDGKCEKGKDCPYKHVKESSRSGTPKKKGKGKGGRSASSNRKSKEEMAKIPCTYFQQGKCRRGDKCFHKHEVAAAPTKDPKRTNSSAPKKKASAKAAPCITQRYACIAKGKGFPKATKAMKDQSHRAVVFSSKVEYIKVPATGEQRKVVHSIDPESMRRRSLIQSQCQNPTNSSPTVLRFRPDSCRNL